ncbi:MAG: preprotein translocase subunit SecG [Oscillospiraceae bacterium]|nr:preprotein translocase subunit SecG [Oscillospiraceae bacterium]
MEIVLTVLEAIASIALIVVVLLQSGKEAGLSGAIAGGSETYLSKSKKKGLDQVLASSTKWIALVWILLTLSLSLI